MLSGRVRHWGCSWIGRQSNGPRCTPRFSNRLGVRDLVLAFHCWPNVAAWPRLFSCFLAIFSGARGALAMPGCTGWQGTLRHIPCPLIWQRDVRGGLNMGSHCLMERRAQPLQEALSVRGTKRQPVLTQQMQKPAPSGCLAVPRLASAHIRDIPTRDISTRHRVTTNSPKTSPAPHQRIVSLLL